MVRAAYYHHDESYNTMHTETNEGYSEYTSIADQAEALFEKASDYAETRFRLFQLKAIDKISDMVATAIAGIIVAIAFIFFLVMFNIALALFIGALLGKAYWGFLILAGFYLLLWFVFRAGNNKWFKTPITNLIIKKFF